LVLFNDDNGNDILVFKTNQESEDGEDGASNQSKMIEYNEHEFM